MSPDKAAKVLGVAVGASAEAVRARFAAAVKESHPDTRPDYNGPPIAPPLAPIEAHSMATLKEARDVLLARASHSQPPAASCPVCRGTGIQAIGLRRFPCVRGCEGG